MLYQSNKPDQNNQNNRVFDVKSVSAEAWKYFAEQINSHGISWCWMYIFRDDTVVKSMTKDEKEILRTLLEEIKNFCHSFSSGLMSKYNITTPFISDRAMDEAEADAEKVHEKYPVVNVKTALYCITSYIQMTNR